MYGEHLSILPNTTKQQHHTEAVYPILFHSERNLASLRVASTLSRHQNREDHVVVHILHLMFRLHMSALKTTGFEIFDRDGIVSSLMLSLLLSGAS
jgi:hypothetical protein